MATHRICFTGMDRAEEEALASLFNRLNAKLGNPFTLATEAEADILVVDVDSIYGHMTWLRMHNRSDLTVVALSHRESNESDHTLLRPVDEARMGPLLQILAGAAVPEASPAPDVVPAKPKADAPSPARPPTPEPPAPVAPAPAEAEPPRAVEATVQLAQPEPAPVIPQRDPELGDYLTPGALPGPVRLDIDGAPPLVIDPGAQAYLGPAQLKGFIPYCKRVIRADDWQPVPAGEVALLASRLGSPQPWGRLAWLHGLVSGQGMLREGLAADDRFQLLKWPQIEREYPKHFRIATAMMKGPQTVAEIAQASSTAPEEVADFVNASLAAGQAERVQNEPAQQSEPAARGGLLGKLKGLRGN